MTVKRWTTPNDANHNNHHAEVGGVEFFRFPYSPYMGRVGQFTATVSGSIGVGGWYYAKVFRPNPNRVGDTILVHRERGTDQDEMFTWAAAQMKALDQADKEED